MKEYSLKDIQKATNNFHADGNFGHGGSANVYKGELDGDKVAVKVFGVDCEYEDFQRELVSRAEG